MKKSATSLLPQKAPEDFRKLPEKVITSDGEGLWITWHGSGEMTDIPCAACGNIGSNKLIYYNWGVSYPNGNKWEDQEIHCGKCGIFSLYNEFIQG